ncbi:MAG: rhodanese-like domain-containing protein [Anaeromyxobacteraceae bacterium]
MRKQLFQVVVVAAVLGSGAALADGPAARLVDGAEAHRLVKEGVKVVDVRTAPEFAAGHVPGAVNIPFDEIERRAAELGPPGTKVLLYCRTGRRSGIAAEALRAKGYTNLFDLQAYDRWVASEPGK